MVKVAKWDKKKKKADWANYRAEIKCLKYGIFSNVLYIMKEIHRFDKFMFFGCFIFAMSWYFQDLFAVYTDKYVVELAEAGFGSRRLVMICLLLIVGNSLMGHIGNSVGTVTIFYIHRIQAGKFRKRFLKLITQERRMLIL